MPRDYVHRRASSRRKSNAPSLKLWGLTLLLIGVFIGVLSYLRMTTARTEPHAHNTMHRPKLPPIEEKVHFDFYTVLPEGNTAHTTATHLKQPEISRQSVEVSEQMTLKGKMQPVILPAHKTFILEVAAFHHFRQADQLKAQLGLLGLEARISEVKIKRSVWSRVWMGPYQDKSTAQRMQQQLQGNHIKSVVLDKDDSNS